MRQAYIIKKKKRDSTENIIYFLWNPFARLTWLYYNQARRAKGSDGFGKRVNSLCSNRKSLVWRKEGDGREEDNPATWVQLELHNIRKL